VNCKLLDAIEDQLSAWNNSRAVRAKRLAEREGVRGPHKPRCPLCGLKIRGPNHKDGDDHKWRAKSH
jgi:hypothetical protein